jgi:hypothetical protein
VRWVDSHPLTLKAKLWRAIGSEDASDSCGEAREGCRLGRAAAAVAAAMAAAEGDSWRDSRAPPAAGYGASLNPRVALLAAVGEACWDSWLVQGACSAGAGRVLAPAFDCRCCCCWPCCCRVKLTARLPAAGRCRFGMLLLEGCTPALATTLMQVSMAPADWFDFSGARVARAPAGASWPSDRWLPSTSSEPDWLRCGGRWLKERTIVGRECSAAMLCKHTGGERAQEGSLLPLCS